jgi:hypothetical protein
MTSANALAPMARWIVIDVFARPMFAIAAELCFPATKPQIKTRLNCEENDPASGEPHPDPLRTREVFFEHHVSEEDGTRRIERRKHCHDRKQSISRRCDKKDICEHIERARY